MSNPYDFTSGFLGAKQLIDTKDYRDKAIKLQQDELAQKEPYLRAIAKNYDANARKTNLDADIIEKGNKIAFPMLDRVANKLNKGVGLNPSGGGMDFSSLNSGYTLGMSMDNPVEADTSSSSYTPSFDRYGVTKPDYSLLPRVKGYVDGSRGGIRLNAMTGPGTQDPALNTEQNDTGAVAAPVAASGSAVSSSTIAPAAASAPPAGDAVVDSSTGGKSSTSSGIQMLAERNPKQADTVVRNIFGMSNREFQQLSGALAMVDFTRGKITSDQMLDQVEKLRKIQAEGVMHAVNEALSGNTDKAKSLFAEYGDDTGEDIEGFKKIRIKNPVPGAAKKTMDEYDGLEVTLKDGKKITIDPRRLATEIVGTQKSMEHDEKVASSIRTTDASVYHTDVAADANRVQRETNQLAKLQHEQTLNMNRIGTEFDKLRDNELQVLKNLTGKTDLTANSKEYKDHMAQFNLELSNAQRLAALNIATPGGAMQIDSETARQLAPMLTIHGIQQDGKFVADQADPAARFWNNPNNFARDKNGKIVSAQVGGRTLFRTINGVLLPAPEQVVVQPKQ